MHTRPLSVGPQLVPRTVNKHTYIQETGAFSHLQPTVLLLLRSRKREQAHRLESFPTLGSFGQLVPPKVASNPSVTALGRT